MPVEEAPKTALDWLMSEKFILTLIILSVVLVVWIASRNFFKALLNNYIKRAGEEEDPQKVMLINALSSIIKGVAVVLGVIFILQINGVQVGALITSASIVSAVVGLALQDAIKDLIQGVHIITDKYFSVGDVIHYEGIDGKVLHVSMRTTKIQDIRTNNIVTIANRHISQSVKLSHQHDIDISLSYEDDSEKVITVLKEACKKIAEIEGVESCGFKGIQEFKESGILYKIRMFSKPDLMPQLHREAMGIIRAELDTAGITIPFAQLDVHLDNKVGDKE